MRFRSGSVSATVWEERAKDGTLFPVVKLTRSFRDKRTQEWKETSDFTVHDLPLVRSSPVPQATTPSPG